MQVEETPLAGLLLITPRAFGDDRGFFLETYSEARYRQAGVDVAFVQANHSRSAHGVLRAIHFQTAPGQAKLMYCPRGRIFQVAVDLRPSSPTFGRHFTTELSDENHRQLFLPVGFGNGFCVLSEVADVTYMVSTPYDAATESEIAWDDPDIAIPWPLDDPRVSDRDRAAPRLADYDFGSVAW